MTRRQAVEDRHARELADALSDSELPGFDDRLLDVGFGEAARGVPRTMAAVTRHCVRAGRGLTVAVLVVELVGALLTAASFLQVTGILNALFAAGPTPQRVHAALPALTLAAALVLGRTVSATVVRLLLARLTPRVTRDVECALQAAAVETDLLTYEDPDWYEALGRARERGLLCVGLAVGQLVALLDAVVGLLAIATVLARLHPLLLVVLAFSVLPDARAARRSADLGYAGMVTWAKLHRRMGVLADLGTDRAAAAEVRAYGLAGFLRDEHRMLSDMVRRESERIERAQVRVESWGRALGGLAAAANVVLLGLLAEHGAIPLAAAGTALLALSTCRGLLRTLIGDLNHLHESGLAVTDLDSFLEDSAGRRLRRTGAVPPAPRHIELTDVSFTYPGSDTPSLQGVNLRIDRGEVIALVGENGSGKSTLARIVAGLMDPCDGAVRWDGHDVRDYDAAAVHRHVAVVEQQATRWPFTVATDIALGDVTTPRDPGRVAAAARNAGAATMIERLPAGYDTGLCRLFHGGHDLSGGQWQSLAFARALYRDAALTVCDEPASALDPRAEHALYGAIGALAADRAGAVLLISHRLSSVRAADRIYVLDRGVVVEVGTHTELMAAGGRYRELYDLQASGYREEAVAMA